jgi:transcriptional regulator with XRE-family HTH domain
MKQPELGRKVSEIRNSIGLTQDELSKNCKLSLRTIQRIESGIVNPRSYTLKIIGDNLDFNFYSAKRKSKRLSFLKDWKSFLINQVIQLFNLKTNTMKKLSILSVSFSVLGFTLFLILSTGMASRANDAEFTKTNHKGITYLFPKGLKIQISNMKDTSDYKIGDDLIQNYKQNIFFNREFVGKVNIGDTIILDNGNLNIKNSFWEFTSTSGKGITYLIPNGLILKSCPVNKNSESLIFNENLIIKVHRNSVFLNSTYIGEAFLDDIVTLRNGSLYITKGNNDKLK